MPPALESSPQALAQAFAFAFASGPQALTLTPTLTRRYAPYSKLDADLVGAFISAGGSLPARLPTGAQVTYL